MSESRNVFEFLVLLCCILFQNVSGITVELTRHRNGDYFNNPNEDFNFCHSANAICSDKHRPAKKDECSYCKCNTNEATFNETHCVSFQHLQGGCRTYLSDDSIKLLDLKKDDDTKLHTFSDERLISAEIISVNWMKVETPPEFQDRRDRWEVEIGWEDVPEKKYDGQVFKVEISYEVDDNKNKRNDCFVFKSKGSINVIIPDLTTTTALPSGTSLPSTTPLPSEPPLPSETPLTTTTPLPSETPLPSTTPLPSEIPLPSTTPLPGTNEKSTTQISPSHTIPPAIEDVTRTVFTIKPGSTNKARNGESSAEGNNAVTVSLAVVGCLLLFGVVVLAVLWYRRRSAQTSKDKRDIEISYANGNAKNPKMMLQPEPIYEEADSSITSPENGEGDLVYDYAYGNVKNRSRVDAFKDKPTYESLRIKDEAGESGGTSTAEPYYHVVDEPEGTQDPGKIYHELEEPGKTGYCEAGGVIGRNGNENPARDSTLEENDPQGTGDDNPERVYNVLEN